MKIFNTHFIKNQKIGVRILLTVLCCMMYSSHLIALDTKNLFVEQATACVSPPWDAAQIYTQGDRVSYQNIEYEAYHWTQNQNPESNNSQWGPWLVIGSCSGPNEAPTVAVTSPISGTTFLIGDTVTITADASDIDGTVTKVEFLIDGTVIGEDTTAPYAINWVAEIGDRTITARATDNGNAETLSSQISILVETDGPPPPTVSIISPTNGSTHITGQSISITAIASDANGTVTKVAFYVDASLIGEDTNAPYTIDWIATEGVHSLTAIATDNDGATTTSSAISVTVENDGGGGNCDAPQYTEGGGYVEGSQVQNDGNLYECKPWPFTGWCNGSAAAYAPGTGTDWADAWELVGECTGGGENPNVAITSPSNLQSFIEGTSITINADATDGNGTISKVEFFSNGTKLGEDTSSPYSFTWSNLTLGNYALTAVATDNDNISTTSSVVNIRVTTPGGGGGPLPARILNGYWHNFDNGTGIIALKDVSPNWDIINVSFAVAKVSPTDGEIGFELAPEFSTINYDVNDFKADIQLLKSQNKKVIISIGGAEGQVRLNTISARDKFINSMIAIVEEYDFDGIDIDFEGQSLSFDFGDTDFANPTTPVIVNTINGIQSICDHFGNDFILTMAPETFFVQLGYSFYGGISQGADRRAGAYLPIIHALRDKLTFLQVQYYNSGQITALDDRAYNMGNSDFYVSLVDMLLKGFPITKDQSKFFPALRPDQILIGVPAAFNAGGGHTGSEGVITALDYLIKGTSFGGQYSLTQTYPDLRGVMSWSINWDEFDGLIFSDAVRAYLDGLDGATASAKTITKSDNKIRIFPNPIIGNQINVSIENEISDTDFRLQVFSTSGAKVLDFKNNNIQKGRNQKSFDISALKGGMYFYTVSYGKEKINGKLIKQ